MKKKILTILAIIITVILLAFALLFIIDTIRMSNNQEVIFSTWGRDYKVSKSGENITENHLEENSEQIVENVEKANSEETATPDKAIPQALSSAELLATIKAANPTADVMQTAEIGIAELRNHENVPDPYLVNNISV